MRNLLTTVLATAALLTFGTIARAQFGTRYAPSEVSALIDRVHADLNHAYESWRFTSGDRKRLDHAEHELRDFEKKWDKGHFDKGELDDAISAVQHVLDNNHMPPQSRDAIDGDVGQLRAMREAYDRHEIGYSHP